MLTLRINDKAATATLDAFRDLGYQVLYEDRAGKRLSYTVVEGPACILARFVRAQSGSWLVLVDDDEHDLMQIMMTFISDEDLFGPVLYAEITDECCAECHTRHRTTSRQRLLNLDEVWDALGFTVNVEK